VKEVLISFTVFLLCISVTIYSQFTTPKPVNAAQSSVNTNLNINLNKNASQPKINLFELDPSDPNPTLFAIFLPWLMILKKIQIQEPLRVV